MNIWYIYLQSSTISFLIGIYSVIAISLTITVESINLEKSNKMFEKMLTMYKVDKIIGAKIIVSIVASSIIGCTFSIINRLVLVFTNKEQFDIKILVLENIILIIMAIFFSTFFCWIYLVINNATICNFIVTPIMTGAMLVVLFVDKIKIWMLVVTGLVMLVMTFVVYKLLSLIKSDNLTKV